MDISQKNQSSLSLKQDGFYLEFCWKCFCRQNRDWRHTMKTSLFFNLKFKYWLICKETQKQPSSVLFRASDHRDSVCPYSTQSDHSSSKKNTFNCQCKNKTFDLAITTSAIFCQKQEAGYPFYQVEAPASQKLNATKIVEMRSLVFEKINSNEIRKWLSQNNSKHKQNIERPWDYANPLGSRKKP